MIILIDNALQYIIFSYNGGRSRNRIGIAAVVHLYRDGKLAEEADAMLLVFTGDRMRRLRGDSERNDESRLPSLSPFNGVGFRSHFDGG